MGEFRNSHSEIQRKRAASLLESVLLDVVLGSYVLTPSCSCSLCGSLRARTGRAVEPAVKTGASIRRFFSRLTDSELLPLNLFAE